MNHYCNQYFEFIKTLVSGFKMSLQASIFILFVARTFDFGAAVVSRVWRLKLQFSQSICVADLCVVELCCSATGLQFWFVSHKHGDQRYKSISFSLCFSSSILKRQLWSVYMGMIATQIDDWNAAHTNFGFRCSIALQVFAWPNSKTFNVSAMLQLGLRVHVTLTDLTHNAIATQNGDAEFSELGNSEANIHF